MQVRILSQSSRMEDVTYPEGEEFEQLGTQVTVPSSILTQQQSNGMYCVQLITWGNYSIQWNVCMYVLVTWGGI